MGRPAVEFRSPLLAVMTGKHHNIQGEDLTVKAVLRSPLKHRKMLRLSNTPSKPVTPYKQGMLAGGVTHTTIRGITIRL